MACTWDMGYMVYVMFWGCSLSKDIKTWESYLWYHLHTDWVSSGGLLGIIRIEVRVMRWPRKNQWLPGAAALSLGYLAWPPPQRRLLSTAPTLDGTLAEDRLTLAHHSKVGLNHTLSWVWNLTDGCGSSTNFIIFRLKCVKYQISQPHAQLPRDVLI